MSHICRKKTKNTIAESHTTGTSQVRNKKPRKVTKQNEHYSAQQISPTYHFPKPQNHPEKHFLDLPQTVIQQPEVNHPEDVEINFPECQLKTGY